MVRVSGAISVQSVKRLEARGGTEAVVCVLLPSPLQEGTHTHTHTHTHAHTHTTESVSVCVCVCVCMWAQVHLLVSSARATACEAAGDV